jgi:hypothetical protein
MHAEDICGYVSAWFNVPVTRRVAYHLLSAKELCHGLKALGSDLGASARVSTGKAELASPISTNASKVEEGDGMPGT